MPSESEVVVTELEMEEPAEDDDLLKWAKEHIGEDPATKCQKISDLRDMIYERGECTPHRTDDAFLLRFLRGRHFVVPRAHRLFVNYHEFKENNPEFVENVDLGYLKRMGDDAIITVPPNREGTGRRILLYRMGQWQPDKYTVTEIFQATIAILEMAILEPQAQILGGICIWDLGGLTMQQVFYLTPSVAQKMVQIMVTSFPMKIHALHVVNQSYIFDVIFNIFKPFLNDKMKERIYFHGENMESLHKHIDPKYLPKRYGGVRPDANYKDWIDSCRRNERIIEEMRGLGYTDSELEAELKAKGANCDK